MKFLSKFFGLSFPQRSNSVATNDKGTNEELSAYVIAEVNSASFIKIESRKIAAAHLLGKIDLLKTGSVLSAEEKRELRLNPRQSLTRELIDLFIEDRLDLDDPKARVKSLYYRALMKKSRIDSIREIEALKIEEIRFSGVGDERECAWCKSVSGQKMPISADIENLIHANCSCNSHCRLTISAVIEVQ